jgi:hypothetical protein
LFPQACPLAALARGPLIRVFLGLKVDATTMTNETTVTVRVATSAAPTLVTAPCNKALCPLNAACGLTRVCADCRITSGIFMSTR